MAKALDEDPVSYRVLFAVGGIVLAQDELFLGPIRFFRMTPEKSKEIAADLYAIVDSTRDDAGVKALGKRRVDDLLESLAGFTVVEVPTTGDSEKAKTLATEISEPALEFIQLIAAIEEPEAKNIKITHGGDIGGRKPPVLVIAEDKTAFSYDQDLAASHRLTLNEETVKRIVDLGFGNTVKAIAKDEDDRTDFEEMLLNAVHWISDAEKQERSENRITSYTTAMELLFTSKDSPITRDLSEGIAYLLGDSLENRKRVKKMVGDLYGKRSAVSHSGKRTIVRDDAYAFKRDQHQRTCKDESLSSQL